MLGVSQVMQGGQIAETIQPFPIAIALPCREVTVQAELLAAWKIIGVRL